MNSINHKVKKTALGQIVAVVAAIFVAYISFMGLVYLTRGRLALSALVALAIGMAWVLLCFKAQQMKGAESRFASSISKERIAVVALAIVLLAPAFPFLHFFSVADRFVRDVPAALPQHLQRGQRDRRVPDLVLADQRQAKFQRGSRRPEQKEKVRAAGRRSHAGSFRHGMHRYDPHSSPYGQSGRRVRQHSQRLCKRETHHRNARQREAFGTAYHRRSSLFGV